MQFSPSGVLRKVLTFTKIKRFGSSFFSGIPRMSPPALYPNIASMGTQHRLEPDYKATIILGDHMRLN
jgi:hypothetical protein